MKHITKETNSTKQNEDNRKRLVMMTVKKTEKDKISQKYKFQPIKVPQKQIP